MTRDRRRGLPSVGALLESAELRPLLERAPRTVVVDAVRDSIEAARRSEADAPSSTAEWAAVVADVLDRATRASLRPVINGTGVVLHTNLGRAPLAPAALAAVARVASGFSNLEYDLERGDRGSRSVHCAAVLRELTGGDDALVVNNGAAALVLVLNTLARDREVIVSRGELVEIGGSFRIPDIMERSGARLVEVGTTNRTIIDDYAAAVGPDTALLVKVHRSNFAVAGFVAEATVADLSALGRRTGIPVLHDLGSGLLVTLDQFGLAGEPTAREALAAGASLVTMSGDKLLGGPQAGIIVGDRELVQRVRKNPLARAMRVDKMTLAALEATLNLYRDPARAFREIPALAQLTASVSELRARAERIAATLNPTAVEVVTSDASVGGGAFPTARIPSIALAIAPLRGAGGGGGAGAGAGALEARLRSGQPPIIARIADGRVWIDLRTVFPDEDEVVGTAIAAALA